MYASFPVTGEISVTNSKKTMKNMKKVVSLMAAIILIFAMSITALAANEKGSITINGVSANNTYEVYKLLDLDL